MGWPICPGFDFSGEVEYAPKSTGLKKGQRVFGFTLFGAYSSRVLVPAEQIRPLPKRLSAEEGSAVPAVAATALHALSLSGSWPGPLITSNRAVLIHSAAGGVGSMLVQMCKILGHSPVVAVVGSPAKEDYCRTLGADHVIVKSRQNLWEEAEKISKNGYICIFDANGIETLSQSYAHLTRCGRLVTYGR